MIQNSYASDVFRYDIASDLTTRVSVATNGTEGNLGSGGLISGVSSDGRFISFISSASNLVNGDTNNKSDVFVHDANTGSTTMVSVSSPQPGAPAVMDEVRISANGRYIIFSSDDSNWVTNDTNNREDVFRLDTDTNTIVRVSESTSGQQGDGYSEDFSISADGRYVAFESYATNLVNGDTNGQVDIFRKDLVTGELILVESNSYTPEISADGQYVVFAAYDGTLVAGDTNGHVDVFLRDIAGGVTTLVSRPVGGGLGDNGSESAFISGDGRYVVFRSAATNLIANDTNGQDDVFRYDRVANVIARVSESASGVESDQGSSRPAISSDGRYVVFDSVATNLIDGQTISSAMNNVYFRDMVTGEVKLVSIAEDGTMGDDNSDRAMISQNGRYVVFETDATNLVVGESDTNNNDDIVIRDMWTGRLGFISRSTVGAEGSGDSESPYMSDDATRFVYYSEAPDLYSPALIWVEEEEEEVGYFTKFDPATLSAGGVDPANNTPAANEGNSSRTSSTRTGGSGGSSRHTTPAATSPVVISPPTPPTTTTICTPYLTENIRLGATNNPEQVKKLETFLNEKQGEKLVVDGIYDQADFEAVKRFQQKHETSILAIWGITTPTGFVSITTRNKINSFYCTAAITCPYFTERNSLTENTNTPEVQKTKILLKDLGFYTGSINQIFDQPLDTSLRNFQSTFAETMLKPWNIINPTGYKYKTTNRFLNSLVGCALPPETLENGATVSY